MRYSGKLHNSRTRGLPFISFLRWDKVISKFPYDNLAIQFTVTFKSRLGTIQWAQILILGTCLEYFFEMLVLSSNSVQPFLFAIVLTSTLAKIIHQYRLPLVFCLRDPHLRVTLGNILIWNGKETIYKSVEAIRELPSSCGSLCRPISENMFWLDTLAFENVTLICFVRSYLVWLLIKCRSIKFIKLLHIICAVHQDRLT